MYCVPGKIAEEPSILCYILGVLINFRNKKESFGQPSENIKKPIQGQKKLFIFTLY